MVDMKDRWLRRVALIVVSVGVVAGCSGDRAVVARAGREVVRVGDLSTMLSDVPVFRVDSSSVEMLVTRWGELTLLFERLDDRDQPIDAIRDDVLRQRPHLVLDLYLQSLGQPVAHVLLARNLALGDLDLVDVLHVLEIADVETRDQRDRHARLARAPGAADAVGVVLDGLGHVEVDHVLEVWSFLLQKIHIFYAVKAESFR